MISRLSSIPNALSLCTHRAAARAWCQRTSRSRTVQPISTTEARLTAASTHCTHTGASARNARTTNTSRAQRYLMVAREQRAELPQYGARLRAAPVLLGRQLDHGVDELPVCGRGLAHRCGFNRHPTLLLPGPSRLPHARAARANNFSSPSTSRKIPQRYHGKLLREAAA